MTDQNRKTLRSFYCRDYLWELFEQMTHELGCSMDYLINESMRLYARSRDFSVEPTQGPPSPPGAPGGFGQPQQQLGQGPMMPPGGFGTGSPPAPPRPQQGPVDRFHVGNPGQGQGFEHRTLERMPSVSANPRQAPAPPAPTHNGLAAGPPPPPPRPNATGGWPPAPPAPPGGAPQTGGFQAPAAPSAFSAPGGRQPLFLHFNGNRYTVDKDKFVIGRGSQQTELTIRDGNISRKHCAVIFHNGSYYIKDLGSTNGIEFKGNRIESKKIEDGDIFYLCDYELRFSYY